MGPETCKGSAAHAAKLATTTHGRIRHLDGGGCEAGSVNEVYLKSLPQRWDGIRLNIILHQVALPHFMGPKLFPFPRLPFRRPTMRVVPVPVRQDNYAYLIIDQPSNKAAAVDVYDVPKVQAAADRLGVSIVAAITTHHHNDHSGGNEVCPHLLTAPIISPLCPATRLLSVHRLPLIYPYDGCLLSRLPSTPGYRSTVGARRCLL